MASEFTLHVFPFSLYSIMARLTNVLGRMLGPEDCAPAINYKLINLHRDEQITPEYLKLNPKGQVPLLTGDSLPDALTDSLDISLWLATKFPNLIPSEHSAVIMEWINDLHSIAGLPLSVPVGTRMEKLEPESVDALLSRTDISQDYRKALEFKRKFFVETQSMSLTEASVQKAEQQSRHLFHKITNFHSGESTWLFGHEPTLADAHIMPFIARLVDSKREYLVPDILIKYVTDVKALPAWDEVTHGRPTLWDVSMGHVGLMNPF